MGASVSKSSVSQNNSTIQSTTASAIVATNQNCSTSEVGNNSTSFDGNITGGTLDIRQVTTQYANLQCVQTASSSVDFSSTIASTLQATLTASAKAGQTIGFSEADSNVNSVNSLIQAVSTSIQITTMQACVATLTANNSINFKGNLTNVDVDATQDISQAGIVGCLQKQTAFVTAASNLASAVTVDASATSSSGLDIGSIIILLILIAGIVLVFLLAGPTAVVNTVLMAFAGLLKLVLSIPGLIIDAVKGIFSSSPPAYSTAANSAKSSLGSLISISPTSVLKT